MQQGGSASDDHDAAERAWAAIRRHGITPVPRHFELWFAFARGDSAELTRRIDAMLARGEAFTPEALEELYQACIASSADRTHAADGAQAVQEIATALVAQVAGNQDGVRAYGQALVHWATHLQRDQSVHGLRQAVESLAAETRQAHARNAVLEQQIASSVVRVGELQQRLSRAERTASTDPLTGLANRLAFDQALRRAVAQARAEAGNVALLLVDIDHFKRVNDSFGHPVGDLVLRLVARVLADNVKGRDCVARYGGEEFAVVLSGASLDAGAIVGEQIRQALSRLPLVNKASKQQLGTITVSVGVAAYRRGDATAGLIARADAALYRAKGAGRNLVCTEAMVQQDTLALAS